MLSQGIFCVLRKELIRFRTRASICNRVCFLQTTTLEIDSNSANQHSPTVSYLLNSCGFSLESALSTSKKINIRSTEKANSVLELFRTHGFTETQIKMIITKRPKLLLSNPEKSLSPKFEFFKSLGISTPDLTKFISRKPSILQSGLESQIIPSCNFLRAFVHTDNNIVSLMKRSHRVFQQNLEKVMVPNISTLRSHSVPDSNISKLLMIHPSILLMSTKRFELSIGVAKELGFDPSTSSMRFLLAVRSMVVQTEASWEQKMEAYRSCGLSKDEVLLAFRSQPMSMLVSTQKIKKLMDFIVNKLHWKPSMICEYPNLLTFSLEKRIIPRCSILQILISMKLIEKDVKVASQLIMNEKAFLDRFVLKYQNQVPEVVKAHQGLMEFKGFSTEFNHVNG